MDLRIRALTSIDPLAAPLPHGTEVTTRVDRVLGDERRVPQGAVGRVVGGSGGEIDVNIVGVGTLRYDRSELTPRKSGQVRYAQRRFSAWEALRGCVVLESTVGSRAWGLAHEGSDHDVRGVFVLPFAWTAGLGEPPRDLASEDGSTTFWEVGKAVRQGLRADPNTLETFFVEGARAVDPIGAWLLEGRDAFVSAEIYGSFGRYALAQLKRLAQAARLAEHRALVLEWLREEPAPSLDDVAGRLAKISPRAAPTEADRLLAAKDHVKQLYRSLFDQGKLAQRDFASLVAFAREGAADLDLPRELRPKNAYNLVRLLGVAIDWLRTGTPSLVTTGARRDLLLAIKQGAIPLDDTLREAERLAADLDLARSSTSLPAHPDLPRADALLRRIAAETARRHLTGAPGPLGASAPPCPEVTWDDRDGEAGEPDTASNTTRDAGPAGAAQASPLPREKDLSMSLLDPHTQSVVDRVLAEEGAKRHHLVIALSGAHAYGFPSPDSDIDMKAVHIEPAGRLLGLSNPTATFDRMGIEEGVEIDYTSNELKPVLLGVLFGNGNYLERLLGRTLLLAAPELPSLQPLVRAALSRRLAAHYIGFATSQREAFRKEPTAKKLLYVLRTALTGRHALLTGEIVTDLGELCEPAGFAAARDLIATKRKGERVALTGADAEHWQAEAERAIALLKATVDGSILPVEAPEEAARALETWLLEVRLGAR